MWSLSGTVDLPRRGDNLKEVSLMEMFTLLTLAALVIKIVTVFKSVGKDNNIVATQVLTWVVGIGILFLASHALITEGLKPFGDTGPALGDMDFASIFLIGLAYASTGSVIYDFKKSRDNSDSSSEPPLLPHASYTPKAVAATDPPKARASASKRVTKT